MDICATTPHCGVIASLLERLWRKHGIARNGIVAICGWGVVFVFRFVEDDIYTQHDIGDIYGVISIDVGIVERKRHVIAFVEDLVDDQHHIDYIDRSI